jgi:hypothetical protein
LTLASVVKEVVTCWRSSSLKKYNLRLKKKIQPVVEATSYKRQASSSKKIQPVVVWISKRKI